jgi:hypothetical protein
MNKSNALSNPVKGEVASSNGETSSYSYHFDPLTIGLPADWKLTNYSDLKG